MNKFYSILLCSILLNCGAPNIPDMIETIDDVPVIIPPEKTVVLPSHSLPNGWVLNREELANWKKRLPEVLGIMLDTGAIAEYWDDPITLKSGVTLPIKRAKVTYRNSARLMNEVVELHFVNVNHIYSVTNYDASHYQLNAVLKSIKLKETRFPQLTSDDILKHKVLMVYGTPKEFDGSWHRYEDKVTSFSVRVIDDLNIATQSTSKVMDRKLKQAIQDVYSEEGVELKKQQLMEGFEL